MSGKLIGSIVKGSAVEPAASIADRMTSGIRYCEYHVPIITIADFCDMNALLASGYCIAPSAPGCMMPSSNSFFHRPNAPTKLASVHFTSPRVALTNMPGSTLSAIAWIVSMLKAPWPAPWTKQVTPLAANVAQTFFHEAQSVGALRPYLSKRSLLIQIVPEKTAPAASALNLPSTVSALTPVDDSWFFQSAPSAFSTAVSTCS